MEETIVLPKLTDEQDRAAESMRAVLQGESMKQRLSVGGYAGTGKTVTIKGVLSKLEDTYDEPAIVAFTGMAVNVLRKKGIPQARTLHNLMYIPHKGPTGRVEFEKVPHLECGSVVVDEASMISLELFQDLMSYEVPVVFVGDHGQLEPIGDDPGVMKRPDIILEQIHRQAEGSPILRYAHARRQGLDFDWSTTSEGLRRLSRRDAMQDLLQYDMILCGFNNTRAGINAMVRHQQGRSEFLEVGDQLVCLRNSTDFGVFNGMTLFVQEILNFSNGYYKVTVRTDAGTVLSDVQLYMPRGDKDYWMQPDEVLIADHGYARTVHKSQGSQADNVLVLEEIWEEKWDMRRWAYTGATRAAKSLTWVDPTPKR